MADISAGYLGYFNNSAAEVPQERFDVGNEYLFDTEMFNEPNKPPYMKTAHLSAADPVLSGKVEPDVGGPVYDPRQQRLNDLESAVASHYHPASNNFWLTPQASNQQLMAFQPALPNQLPPVGAEYQIQSGMDSIASPYSPESDGSLGDEGEGSFTLPPGFDPTDEKGLLKLTEEQLVSLTARDLNRLCRDLPEDIIKQLKKRRRTLKNRGYAYNSRVRRVSQKNQLEKERDELQKQISQLQDRVKNLEREANLWKQKAQSFDRGVGEGQ